MKDRMSYLLSLSFYFRMSSLDCFYLDNNFSYWYVEKYIQYIININLNHSLGIDAFVSQACQLALLSTPFKLFSYSRSVLRSCPKLVVMAAPLDGPVGSYSLSLTPSSSGLGPIPSTFCPSIGSNTKIPLLILVRSNPLLDPVIARLNPCLLTFNQQ